MDLAPAVATVQRDADGVRVTRWDLPPQSQTGHHRHEYDYIVVPIIDGVLTIRTLDGDEVPSALTAGSSYSRPAGVEHNVCNCTDAPIAFVEIELLS